jgi:hypothetical protein
MTQRVHEIGIRMAVGAEGKDILRMVIGSIAALILTRVISSFSHLLYGVRRATRLHSSPFLGC